MCSQKGKIQDISDRNFILSPGPCPRDGNFGALGTQVVKKLFFKHGHVAYQIEGDDGQNRMKEHLLS